ncbi:hypothetical protein PVAG01_04340 [Phlyctema vagabunda]|uniref:Uncharacterized protein n=1 Tax=Phlyctema vagabunda TaxID=108571 RepID=A0ABR4PP23_9HELO
MSSKKQRNELGDSWVVQEEEEEEEREEEEDNANSHYFPHDDYEGEQEPPRRRSSRKPRRPSNRSSEPEFVMPTLEGSWGDMSSESRVRMSKNDPSPRQRKSLRQEEGDPIAQAGTTSRGRRSTNQTSKKSVSEPKSSILQDIMESTFQQAGVVLSAIFTIFGKALRILQTPLAYMVAVGLLLSFGILVRNIITSSVYASLSTVCVVPGSAYVLPFCSGYQASSGRGYDVPIEFEKAMKVQSNFEDVLVVTAGNVGLPLEMKRGEASIRDLRQLVKYSQLQAKDELGFEFDGFVKTASIASADLQRFNSRVGRAVDGVISITKWTTRVLDDIQTSDLNRGLLNGYLYDTILAPFQSVTFTETRMTEQYIKHSEAVEKELATLIEHAERLVGTLHNLEDRLDAIGDIGRRDSERTGAKRREILLELWTMLGGNRRKLSNMERQLGLLQQVTVYQDKAMGYVMGTLVRLQAMSQEMAILREEVGSPRVLSEAGDSNDRPIKIPLAVHISNIESAVARLDASRQNSRKLEGEQLKSVMDKGKGQTDENLIGS